MARSATPQRPADRRTGYPDGSTRGHFCLDAARPASASGLSAGDGAAVPTATATLDQKTQALNHEDNPWAALPEADRQRLGRHFARLLLLAVRSSPRIPVPETFP